MVAMLSLSSVAPYIPDMPMQPSASVRVDVMTPTLLRNEGGRPLRNVVVALDVLERHPERRRRRVDVHLRLGRIERRHPHLRLIGADELDAVVARRREREIHEVAGRLVDDERVPARPRV